MRLRTISPALLFTLSSAGVLLAPGCGPETPTPVTPVASVSSQKPIAAQVVEDRSPVEQPPGIVASLHLSSPKAIAKAWKSWVPGKTAGSDLDPRMIVPAMLSARATDRIVDIDKPIDVAVQIGGEGSKKPRPNVVVAFGIEDDIDFATALKDTYRIEVVSGGIRRLVPTAPAARNESCVIVPALGPAKRRLVCSVTSEHDIHSTDVLGPWLARGVTSRPEGAPVHGELDVAALRKVFANDWQKAHDIGRSEIAAEMKVGHAELDKVIKKYAKVAVDDVFDFLEELDGISADAQLGDAGPLVSFSGVFSDKKAWLTRAFLLGSDIASKVPDSFGKLPAAGVWLAAFRRGSPQADALGVPYQSMLLEVIEAMAVDFKWAKKDKDLALEIVRLMFMKSADMSLVAGDKGKVAAKDSTDDVPYSLRDILPALHRKSWAVGLIETDGKPVVELYTKLSDFLGRPVFPELVRELSKDHISVKVKVDAKAPKGLPKGAFARSLAFDLGTFDGTGKKAKVKPVTKFDWSLLVVPEGTHTWTAGASNLSLLELFGSLSGAMDGTAAPKVATLGGFDVATKGTPSGGGILMMDVPLRSLDKQQKVEEVLTKLPDGGKGPLAWRSTAQAKGPKSTSELTVQIPRDLIALMAYAMRGF